MPPISERAVRIDVAGEPRWGRLDGDQVALDDGTRIAEAEATFLAPVEPTKIIAVHLSYRSRVEEYRARTPPQPSYFMKPTTTLNGHRGVLRRPQGARFLNYEGEVAAVVGRPMKGVPIDQALDYVAGYACANDVGLHDFRHADRGAMLRVKGQDGFLPMGPEIVPAAGFDPTDYTLRTYLNGEVVQEATADDLIFPVAYQLADLCRLITLLPGDVILTRHACQLAADGAGRRRRGGGHRSRQARQHRRRVGRRPFRARRAAAGVRADPPRRAHHPRGRGGAARRRRGARVRLRAIDHVCLRVADLDEAAARWCLQFGLVERARENGRALLACNDEPYSLELVAGGDPGLGHYAFELAHDCSLDEARADLRAARDRLGRVRGLPVRGRPGWSGRYSSCRPASP